MRSGVGIVCAVAALMAGVPAAGVIRPDHLECYKLADSGTAHTYTADLDGRRVEPRCRIVAKAKLLCTQTTKTNISPPPPGAPAAGAAGQFLCYALKCKKAKTTVTMTDQFGSRAGVATVSKMLCAPAEVVSTQSTTTTTVPGTTTTTLPCAAGVPVGGACWALGAAGNTCTQVCNGQSRTYDPATASYAGSGGTDDQCKAVLDALGASTAGGVQDASGCNYGCGFDAVGGGPRRCTDATTQGGSAVGIERACACD